jgi:hypothetical protein
VRHNFGGKEIHKAVLRPSVDYCGRYLVGRTHNNRSNSISYLVSHLEEFCLTLGFYPDHTPLLISHYDATTSATRMGDPLLVLVVQTELAGVRRGVARFVCSLPLVPCPEHLFCLAGS